MIRSNSRYRSGSPMVDGIISLGGESANSRRTRSTISMLMRRFGSPDAFRFSCVLLYGEWSSHIRQCRLQSSGLVSNVMRHGAGWETGVDVGSPEVSAPFPGH